MVLRYIIAIFLTVVLLGVARRTSTRHSTEIEVKAYGITFVHETVTESFGETPVIKLKVSETSTVRAIVSYTETPGGPYKKMEMAVTDYGFITDLPALEKGHKWFYHIEAMKDNMKIAQIPPDVDQFVKFKGHVSPFVLFPHIFFMFATIFFGILAVFTSIDYARGRGDLPRSVRFLLLTLISAFMGGFPFGIAVTYQTFGESWGGWPIGRDFTDTKTEIFFLFWLIAFLISWKGLRGGEIKVSPRTFSTIVVVSFIVTLITFLIPHSI
jgi:hypothetical protein